jgi:hypothetical protein
MRTHAGSVEALARAVAAEAAAREGTVVMVVVVVDRIICQVHFGRRGVFA